MKFHKYQALGNDYLVLEEGAAPALAPALVRRICDRHLGVGSDGILLGARAGDGFSLRILNPDGSEAEKSGNGLRIFARYLHDEGLVGAAPFAVETKGGRVRCEVRDGGRAIFVEMGQARFDSAAVPVAGPAREVVAEPLEVLGEIVRFTAVTVGNPHCVIHEDDADDARLRERALRLGPALETHPAFPNRTNVQFVRVIDPGRIRIEIWERGAGYTLASGSSSCAAAAASVKLGRCRGDVTVLMPGGALEIGVGADFGLTMLGPARKVAEGTVAQDLLEDAQAAAGSEGA
jgi:diaminopimelate epimerase